MKKGEKKDGLNMDSKMNEKYLIDGKYGVADLLDINQLKTLFDEFNRATGFTIGFLDHPGLNVLIATGWKNICVKFHRKSPKSLKNCIRSNHILLDKLTHPGQVVIEECKNGMVDRATPIIIEGKHIASLATGQMLLKKPDLSRFKRQAKEFGYNERDYLKALDEVSVVDAEKLRATTKFLGSMAVILSQAGYANLISKRAEKEARENEEKFKNIFNSINDAVVIHNLNGKILEVNDIFLHRLSYSRKDLFDLSPSKVDSPKFAKNIPLRIKEVLSKGSSIFETAHVTKFGEEIPTEVNAKLIKFNGEKAIISICRNITVRKKTEEELKKSEERFRLLFEKQQFKLKEERLGDENKKKEISLRKMQGDLKVKASELEKVKGLNKSQQVELKNLKLQIDKLREEEKNLDQEKKKAYLQIKSERDNLNKNFEKLKLEQNNTFERQKQEIKNKISRETNDKFNKQLQTEELRLKAQLEQKEKSLENKHKQEEVELQKKYDKFVKEEQIKGKIKEELNQELEKEKFLKEKDKLGAEYESYKDNLKNKLEKDLNEQRKVIEIELKRESNSKVLELKGKFENEENKFKLKEQKLVEKNKEEENSLKKIQSDLKLKVSSLENCKKLNSSQLEQLKSLKGQIESLKQKEKKLELYNLASIKSFNLEKENLRKNFEKEEEAIKNKISKEVNERFNKQLKVEELKFKKQLEQKENDLESKYKKEEGELKQKLNKEESEFKQQVKKQELAFESKEKQKLDLENFGLRKNFENEMRERLNEQLRLSKLGMASQLKKEEAQLKARDAKKEAEIQAKLKKEADLKMKEALKVKINSIEKDLKAQQKLLQKGLNQQILNLEKKKKELSK